MADIAGTNGERKDFSVVGKPNIPGRLSYSIATGKAQFGSDVVVPNMLHAKFLRSPHARALVKGVDATKAKAIPGVVDIITWEDAELKALGGGAGPAWRAPAVGALSETLRSLSWTISPTRRAKK